MSSLAFTGDFERDREPVVGLADAVVVVGFVVVVVVVEVVGVLLELDGLEVDVEDDLPLIEELAASNTIIALHIRKKNLE